MSDKNELSSFDPIEIVHSPTSSQSAPSPKQSRGCGAYIGLAILVLAIAAAVYFLAPRLFPGQFGPAAATPEPDVITIEEIAPLAELATVHYKSVADITRERVPDNILKHLGAREQIVMLVYGDVKAGFDLSQLNEENLWTDGKRVQLVLPPPKILSSSIDFDRTRIVAYDRTFFLPNDPELEKETLGDAKEKIVQSAIDSGILETARQYGVTFFENYLRALGFDEVRVIVQ